MTKTKIYYCDDFLIDVAKAMLRCSKEDNNFGNFDIVSREIFKQYYPQSTNAEFEKFYSDALSFQPCLSKSQDRRIKP